MGFVVEREDFMQQNNQDNCQQKIDTMQENCDNLDENQTQNNVVDATKKTSNRPHGAKLSVNYLAKISILSALAVVLLYLEFPLFPATPWLEINFSDVPTLLASFMFGPVSGAVVNAVKVGMCLLLRGTSTGFVGDLSNLVSGTLYALVAGLIYLLHKNKRGAIVSLAVGSVVFCLSMWLCNQWFLLPMFHITDSNVVTVTLWWTLLFNVIKTVATSVITFFLYKSTHRLFLRF